MEVWKHREKLWKLTYDLCFNSIAHSPNIPYMILQHSVISVCFLSVFLTSRKEFDWVERFVSVLYSHFCRVKQKSTLGPCWYGHVCTLWLWLDLTASTPNLIHLFFSVFKFNLWYYLLFKDWTKYPSFLRANTHQCVAKLTVARRKQERVV